ncbi:MAG: DUF2283 domain-containing protein [Gemmatimonadales bacterium]
MRATYDEHTDTLTVILREDTPVADSDGERPGVILDFAADGALISVEILDASRRVTDAKHMEFSAR